MKKEKNTNEIENSRLNGNINVSVIRKRVVDTFPELVEKSKIDEKGLDELIRKIGEKQRNLGVPQEHLEERIFRRVFAVLKKPFMKPIDPEEVKDYEEHQKELDIKGLNLDSEPEIHQYAEDDEPNYYSEDVFEWRNKIYFKVNDKPAEFFVIDYGRNKCFETRISLQKKGEMSIVVEGRQEVYGNVSFERVIEYEPFSKGIPRQYRFLCKSWYGERSYMGTFDEIAAAIDSDGLLYKEHKIKEVLKKSRDLLQKVGDYEISKLPPYPGFFWIDSKLQSSRNYNNQVNKKDLETSLKFLDEFAEYYEGNESKIGYILSWMIMAPFTFAMKQAQNPDLPGAVYLVGKANSGKTTVASLMTYIWKTSKSETLFSTGRIDTVARFGNAISKMTYPVIFDEGDIIFKEGKGDIQALFKSSVFDMTARSVMDSNRKNTNIPALSSILFTSNYQAPANAAIGRRMHTFEFSVDHIRTQEEINTFNELFDPQQANGPMKTLNAIGNWVAQEMLNHPNHINKPWLELAKNFWKKMYQEVNLDIPDWLLNPAQPAGLLEASQAEDEKLFNALKKLVLRNAKDLVTGEEEFVKARDKALDVIIYSKESWIQLVTPKRGPDKDKKFVCIDAGICHDMEKEFGFEYDLKRIAEDLNGTYQTRYINGRNRKVAYWELKEFLEMFDTM